MAQKGGSRGSRTLEQGREEGSAWHKGFESRCHNSGNGHDPAKAQGSAHSLNGSLESRHVVSVAGPRPPSGQSLATVTS